MFISGGLLVLFNNNNNRVAIVTNELPDELDEEFGNIVRNIPVIDVPENPQTENAQIYITALVEYVATYLTTPRLYASADESTENPHSTIVIPITDIENTHIDIIACSTALVGVMEVIDREVIDQEVIDHPRQRQIEATRQRSSSTKSPSP
jgi:hypothetical protein